MKTALKIVSFIGLGITIASPFAFFAGAVGRQIYLNLMIAGMIVWFGTAVFWIKKNSDV